MKPFLTLLGTITILLINAQEKKIDSFLDDNFVKESLDSVNVKKSQGYLNIGQGVFIYVSKIKQVDYYHIGKQNTEQYTVEIDFTKSPLLFKKKTTIKRKFNYCRH